MFGSEFESMKSYTGFEKFVGIFSKQKAQRMRTDRVRGMSLAGNLQELLAKSDTIVGILKEQKNILDQRYKSSEASLIQVIERRKNAMVNLEAVQKAHRGTEPAAARHREQDRLGHRPEGPDRTRRRTLQAGHRI